MTRRSWMLTTVMTGAVTASAVVRAQPGLDPLGEAPPGGPPAAPPPDASPPDPAAPEPPTADDPHPPVDAYDPRMEEPAPPPRPYRPIKLPEVLSTPTGWLLPAAVLYSRTAIDTGGGLSSDNRVGLGDVAEFGIATTDKVRIKEDRDAPTSRIQPYALATFRMGVAEDRLFAHQPGLVLGFRKSFLRSQDGFQSRFAELTLVASKQLGSRAAIHVGGAFWDAELRGRRPDGTPFTETLHGNDNPDRPEGRGVVASQVRAFGGIQARPLERSEILIDIGWAPEFCKNCSRDHAIALRPELSWGVRYRVAEYLQLESGVRVPDIGKANLLDAQIFGQATFTSWALRRAVDSIK
jgi:hypothetical protein